MTGQIPGFIEKGKPVLYKNKKVVVTHYYFTCPCAIGHTTHHPSADLLMLVLDGIGEVPFSCDEVKPVK